MEREIRRMERLKEMQDIKTGMRVEKVNGVRRFKEGHGVKMAIGSQRSRKSNESKERSDELRECMR